MKEIKQKILGFSGRKQSGKTSAAFYISARASVPHDTIDFSSYLKEIVLNCFGEPDENGCNLYARNVLGDSEEDKQGTLPCGSSARELLQWLGTDVMRSKDPECWIKAYTAKVIKGFHADPPLVLVLTADIRFPNEVACIQRLGGHIIRLLRNPLDDKHESETSLDTMEQMTRWGATYYNSGVLFDAVIDNREMSLDEKNEAIWKLITDEDWI